MGCPISPTVDLDMPQTDKRLRLAILISGSGTNLQAMLDRIKTRSLAAEVVVVASDRADAFGLERARNAGIPIHVVEYSALLRSDQKFNSLLGQVQSECSVDLIALDERQQILRDADPDRRRERLARLVLAEHALIQLLDRYEPDYICLAGFMRLLTPFFLGHYNRGESYRVINIHPALLPAFPGQHGYQDTFTYGCKWGGITVHFADEGEDTGPIIAQAVYPIWPGDDVDAVRNRGLRIEYEIYAQCLNWIAREQLTLHREASGKPRVVITDQAYGDVLRSWLSMALV
jgi:phosphoribosylglycinamide formyltransferase 1